MKRCLWFVLVTATWLTAPAWGERVEQDGVVLMRGDCHTEAEAVKLMQRFAASHHDLATWAARRDRIRTGILQGAKLSLSPDRKPPAVFRHGQRAMDGYTVEKMAIETVPGFWSTGNLYLPADVKDEPIAVVLCPHGHWQNGRWARHTQVRSAAMARMGAAVFAVDMVGHAESAPVVHHHPQSLRLQIWNSIRAVDFLSSWERIDTDRIAVTGASGGGTQTFLLSAVDDRTDLSMPVCQVSAHFYGGCVCESGLPIHVSPNHETNNVEFAALFAPKPQLLVSNGEDWTKNTPRLEFPYVKNIYAYYGKQDAVQNAHFADEGHDYGPSKREAAYRFIAKYFGLQLSEVLDDEGKLDESWFVELSPEQLSVFDDEHPRPAHAAQDAAEVFDSLDRLLSRDAP